MKYFRSIKLSGISTILFVLLTLFVGCNSTTKKSSDYYLLVGTFTDKTSEGIYVYKFDTDEGTLKQVSAAKGIKNPSYLAVSDDQKYVYAVSKQAGDYTGYINAFSFDKENGKLEFLNKQSSGGQGPSYVAIDQTGKYVFAANYQSGSFSMLPVNKDGSLKDSAITVQHQGSSVDKDRQKSPHVHCTYVTPDNRSLIVNDLGTDHVSQYAFDASKGTLDKSPMYQYNAEPGEGPRHVTFHPNGNFAYVITEMGGKVVTFDFHSDTLDPIQTISALPKDYEGPFTGADIHVSPDGKFLYTSLREELNDVAIFNINQKSGKLSPVGLQSTQGKHPRNFMIDPTGKYLLAANMNSDNIVVFKRDTMTGKIAPNGTEVEISKPACLKMIPVN